MSIRHLEKCISRPSIVIVLLAGLFIVASTGVEIHLWVDKIINLKYLHLNGSSELIPHVTQF